MNKELIGEIEIPKHQKFVSVLVLLEGEPHYVETIYGRDGKFRFGYDEDAIVGVEKWMPMPSRDQPSPLKIGHGVTVENIGFGSEKERKPYLVFDNGYLTEVNLIDVSLVSKRQVHTIADLEDIGVRVEQPAPVADHTQCEECKGWGYHENHHEGGGTECGECGGSGNAPVALVMPERLNTEGGYSLEAETWYNLALDDVASLNGVNK